MQPRETVYDWNDSVVTTFLFDLLTSLGIIGWRHSGCCKCFSSVLKRKWKLENPEASVSVLWASLRVLCLEPWLILLKCGFICKGTKFLNYVLDMDIRLRRVFTWEMADGITPILQTPCLPWQNRLLPLCLRNWEGFSGKKWLDPTVDIGYSLGVRVGLAPWWSPSRTSCGSGGTLRQLLPQTLTKGGQVSQLGQLDSSSHSYWF